MYLSNRLISFLRIVIIFCPYRIKCQIKISLPENYNKFEVPRNKSGGPLILESRFKYIGLTDVNTERQTIKLSMEFKLDWVDERLNITVYNEDKIKVTLFN